MQTFSDRSFIQPYLQSITSSFPLIIIFLSYYSSFVFLPLCRCCHFTFFLSPPYICFSFVCFDPVLYSSSFYAILFALGWLSLFCFYPSNFLRYYVSSFHFPFLSVLFLLLAFFCSSSLSFPSAFYSQYLIFQVFTPESLRSLFSFVTLNILVIVQLMVFCVVSESRAPRSSCFVSLLLVVIIVDEFWDKENRCLFPETAQ